MRLMRLPHRVFYFLKTKRVSPVSLFGRVLEMRLVRLPRRVFYFLKTQLAPMCPFMDCAGMRLMRLPHRVFYFLKTKRGSPRWVLGATKITPITLITSELQ